MSCCRSSLYYARSCPIRDQCPNLDGTAHSAVPNHMQALPFQFPPPQQIHVTSKTFPESIKGRFFSSTVNSRDCKMWFRGNRSIRTYYKKSYSGEIEIDKFCAYKDKRMRHIWKYAAVRIVPQRMGDLHISNVYLADVWLQ